ncbi:MAG TPA: hypothetical protein VK846_04045 [Candidatus Limnocylindria bacterium]|nr:hypothetical protein [Candidatus Limnocylindria bacterium]
MPQSLRIALLLFAALTIFGFAGFLFWRGLRKSEEPTRLIFKWVVTFIIVGWVVYEARKAQGVGKLAVLLYVALPSAVVMIFVWGRAIGEVIARPFSNLFSGGDEEPDAQPLYSTAEALRKRGKCREAIYAIQEQLQKFPSDFIGQMMLAEIQAENVNDLQAAETTVLRFCEQPKHTPANIAFALNSLADWHLKLGQDAEAARRALEKIIEILPDTEFERTAANRIAHLATTEQLVRSREPATVKMKPGVEYLGMLKSQEHLLPKEKGLQQEAAEIVAQLEVHPMDNEARERLAVIYAREYGRLDLATDQIEQLVALPGESPKHVARWLNVLADLHVEATGKTELAEQTLRRIVEMFPNHSHADMAEARISSLSLELKRFEKGRVVKFSPSENR